MGARARVLRGRIVRRRNKMRKVLIAGRARMDWLIGWPSRSWA